MYIWWFVRASKTRFSSFVCVRFWIVSKSVLVYVVICEHFLFNVWFKGCQKIVKMNPHGNCESCEEWRMK